MTYVCQLNLTEVPSVQVQLADVALIVFFVDLERFIETGCAPETWRLRAYDRVDNRATCRARHPAPNSEAEARPGQVRL